MNLRFLNYAIAQFLVIAPAGTAVGGLVYAGVASYGFVSDALRLTLMAMGVFGAALFLRVSWRAKNYQINPTIPNRDGLNIAGHVFIFLGNVAIMIAIPIVVLSNREPYYVLGGMAVMIGGGIATIGWVIGSALIRHSTITPTPDTHVRCPDCQKLIMKNSHMCEYCGCKLIPYH